MPSSGDRPPPPATASSIALFTSSSVASPLVPLSPCPLLLLLAAVALLPTYDDADAKNRV